MVPSTGPRAARDFNDYPSKIGHRLRRTQAMLFDESSLSTRHVLARFLFFFCNVLPFVCGLEGGTPSQIWSWALPEKLHRLPCRRKNPSHQLFHLRILSLGPCSGLLLDSGGSVLFGPDFACGVQWINDDSRLGVLSSKRPWHGLWIPVVIEAILWAPTSSMARNF